MSGRILEPRRVEVEDVTLFLWWDNRALIDCGKSLDTKGPQGFYEKLRDTFSKYQGGEEEIHFDDIEVIGSLIYNSVKAGSRKMKVQVPIEQDEALDYVNNVEVWSNVFSVLFGTAPNTDEVTSPDTDEKKSPQESVKPGT